MVLGAVGPAAAQPLGTFRWQLLPYCNVLTLAVTQVGGVYRMEGTDDQCGAGPASAIGTAFPRPDGTIGIGLNIVAAATATPVHLDASLSLAGFGGTWHDSGGNSGALALQPGPATPGAPRPAGGLGGVAVTTVAAGAGLTGGGTAGTVNLAVSFAGSGSAVSVARSDHTHARGAVSAENTAVGESALGAPSNALGNTAMGHQALSANATGNYNTAVGAGALQSNVTGLSNVAVGERALIENQSGSTNIAVGTGSISDLTSGSGNTALGHGTLSSLAAGGDNTAIGRQALVSITSGSGNIAIGALAGLAMSGGTNNIYIGNQGFAPDNNTIRIGNANHAGTIITGIANQTSAGGVPGPDQRRRADGDDDLVDPLQDRRDADRRREPETAGPPPGALHIQAGVRRRLEDESSPA